MKKVLSLVLALLMFFSLSACGKDTASAQNVDLQKVCDEAIASLDGTDAVFFPASGEDEIFSVYPDLKTIDCKQMVAYFHPILGAPCEVVMLEVENDTDVETAQAALQSRIDLAANDTFYTDNAQGWKNNAAVYVNGNYVVLSCLPDGVEKPAAFKAEF